MQALMILADAVNAATSQAAAAQNTPQSSSPKWWIAGGVCTLLLILYGIGKRADKKQAHKFLGRMNEDLVHLLKDSFNGTEQELERQLSEMWKHNPLVNFGDKVLRIELTLTKSSDNVVECQVQVRSRNDKGQEFVGSASRSYDWDYLPADVSKILIRSGKKSESLILYPPQN